MADMDWVREIEQTLLTFPDEWSCPCSYCVSTRRLIAIVRLAEKSAHQAEKMLDLDRITSARLELSGLVTRLRSGEVEEKP